MKVIKFGGTAFQTPKLVDNVCSIIDKEEKPLIVVASAIGRKGFPFATDTLIDSIKDNYLSNKELDRLLGLGEIYSTLFLVNALKRKKIKAYALSYLETGIECNDNYNDGNIVCIDNKNYGLFSEKYDVLVIPGFVGYTNENEIITLGRGTSDLTAVELALVNKLDEVILYKEVDGIYPTLFINLIKIKPFEFLSYDELLALIEIGFSPINKKAVLEAKENNLKIIVKNFILNNKSTTISNQKSNNKVIGFNVDNNKVMIATSYKEEVQKELFEILKLSHIYIKEIEEGLSYFSFKINSSQLLLLRQIILKKYFIHMLNV
ncbi:MAG: hypothetical protein E7177_04005 [Erysipelotrichaceae bacterium]|nr:hypothetical protein [Erysipelotrichaceae bacterium]